MSVMRRLRPSWYKKHFYILFLKRSVVRRKRTIRHKNIYMIFIFYILKRSLVWREWSIRQQNYLYNFGILKESVVRHEQSIRY